MSLINDALKRAQESQPKNPSPTLPPIPEPAPESKGPSWMLIGLIILLIVNAVIFINLGVSHKKEKSRSQPTINEANRVAVVETPAPASPQPVEAVVAPVVEQPPVTKAETNPSPAPAPPAPPVAPLKVQGIVFSKQPWAIVNGKSVSVGDRVRNFRIVEITPSSVKFMDDDGKITKVNAGD